MEEFELDTINANHFFRHAVDKNTVNQGDIISTVGVDLYGFEELNKPRKTLAIDSLKRKNFFDNRPGLLALLQKEEWNPLLEEGVHVDTNNRDKEGEYFIGFDALQVFVDEKIRKHVTSDGGLPYNTKNLFLIKNDEVRLHDVIRDLHLKEGEDAKFIYVNNVHAIAFYLRHIHGRMHCFVADSEPFSDYVPAWLVNAIRSNFPDAAIVRSTQVIQKDFYSCTTFAIKALMYFMKHGDDVFPYLFDAFQRGGVIYDEANKCDNLREDMLMPQLLKMSQVKLSASEKDLIVSKKANLTLSEYWKKHEVLFGGSSYNSAALEKKYHYLDIISKGLKK